MSTSSKVSLGSLRIQAQERSDTENNPAISTEAWNSFLTNSYKTLYDMLLSAYGNDYYVATTYSFTTTNAQSYGLPDGSPAYVSSDGTQAPKFYKLLGVDLQYSSSPSGYVSLKRFEFIERNKFASPNTSVSWNGYSNLRYRLEGDNLFLVPIPMVGQTARIWYAPAPTNLQFRLPAASVAASAVLGSMSDTTGVTIGMNITGTGIPANTTVSAVGSTTITLSQNASASLTSTLASIWSDSTLIEGIAGWEDFVIVDSAIKAQGKQENDTSNLWTERAAMVERINAMAEGRDAGQAQHVSDVLGAGGDDFGVGWDSGGF